MPNFYISRNGKQSGPFTSVQLKQMADSGLLDPHDQIAQEGSTQWSVASTVRGLFTTTPIPTASQIDATTPEETEMPWLPGAGESSSSSTGSASYKRKPLAHKSATKNQAMPYIIGGVVAVVLLVLVGIGATINSGGHGHGKSKGNGGIPGQNSTSENTITHGSATKHGGDREPTVKHIKAVFTPGMICDRKGFFEHYGKPDQTTDFNGETIFVYNCSDGSFRMTTVVYPEPLPEHPEGTFAIISVEQNY